MSCDQVAKEALEHVVGFLRSSAAESPDSVKTQVKTDDDEETAAWLEHLLASALQPQKLGID